MPNRIVLPVILLCAGIIQGCAGLSGGGFKSPESPEEILRSLSRPRERGYTLRGEAEVTLSLDGRRVSLPGAVLLRPPDRVRIDLLDPLDRPVAVIFSEDARLVYYQPGSATAAALFPLPRGCREVTPGRWVEVLAGAVGGGETGGGWQVHSLPGRKRLARYDAATLQQEIEWLDEGGELLPRSSVWYCDGEPVLRLRVTSFRREGPESLPVDFTVAFPGSGLVMAFRFTALETVGDLAEGLLTPALPRRVRWTSWDLFQGE
jgi:hypothetical protein